ncbi:hypothetical protein MZE89_09175 [Escherichia coli]|uniref:hypothetical protein n=1 Tax=Escherichia coli TaxID=562 RepID=UPI00042964B3|nr:hypothetical protein [Escherichia coli]EFD6049088.1 hypothetical protein [Escherichia coli]EFE7946196.1 hypothetical protein [Escherichia coli]EFM9960943.1 hypothetical protein [Escherichia coli]EFT2932756.1 hypothetical protein [Escherichia coli]EHP9830465.1 hypothetical protein [Escherichia coli]
MSKREIKTKKIIYKEVTMSGVSKTLQSMLMELLKKHTKADSRKEMVNPGEEDLFRLINKHEEFQGMLFCQLVAFEPGHSQRYIQLKNDAESYEIRSVTSDELSKMTVEEAEEARTEREQVVREFIDSILYFGVFGNSIVVMQSRSLTTRELETHLKWLLGSLSNYLGAENILKVSDKPKEEIIEEVLKRPVKSVSIGAPVTAVNELRQGSKSPSWVPAGTASELLKAMLAEKWESFLRSSKLEDCLDDANLEVTLKITYKRKTSDSGERMLRNLVDATRHYPDDDVVVEMVGGTRLTGKEIRLWNTVKLTTYNSLIDEHELYGQMHDWMVALINNGEIEETDE